MKTLAIVGAGDLGQQIAYYAISDNHYQKVVFFDDFNKDKTVNGHTILGNIDQIEESYAKKEFDELFIGIGYKHLRKKKELFDKYYGRIPFGKIIHSSSWVDTSAEVNEGTIIYPSCSIDANVNIGHNTVLNIGCTIAHDTNVSNHCFLSPRVALAGFVLINELSILGINSTIIDNIIVAPGIQIGGGTVVIKNLDQEGLYVGNPARFIR